MLNEVLEVLKVSAFFCFLESFLNNNDHICSHCRGSRGLDVPGRDVLVCHGGIWGPRILMESDRVHKICPVSVFKA